MKSRIKEKTVKDQQILWFFQKKEAKVKKTSNIFFCKNWKKRRITTINSINLKLKDKGLRQAHSRIIEHHRIIREKLMDKSKDILTSSSPLMTENL